MLCISKYYQKDVIVADIVATDAPFCADPCGNADSTAAIQRALDACRDMGGGVVFLPSGHYLVTDTITISAGCVLQGDWQDPNEVDRPEYGTVILAKPRPLSDAEIADRAARPLLNMEGRCGMIGLTFYYPDQRIDRIVPYGYTIYSEAPANAALRDITMINSYRGVGVGANGVSGHELMQNESLRICALDTAIEMYLSSEVGNTVDIDVSPKYWIDAGLGWNCIDATALRDHCRAHTVGIIIQQLDDEHLSSLRLDHCYIGIYMPKRKRLGQQAFWGLIYDVTITDSTSGIVIEELSTSIGAVIAKARIDASEKAIVNSSRAGTLKLCGIECTGKGNVCNEGGRTMWDRETDLSSYDISYGRYQKSAPYLYEADIKSKSATGEDVSDIIQDALDEAAATGGVVYLAAGVYTVVKTLRVPVGVQLRGPSPVFIRDSARIEPRGCVLLSYVGDGATIELADHAGVYGLRIFCPLYDTKTALTCLKENDPVIDRCIGIKGMGQGVYTYNVGVSATMVGIDFTDCDGHLIKQTFGCTYHTFARVGGRGGVVESCLNNPHFINRQNFAGRGYCNAALCNPSAWEGYCATSEIGTQGVGFSLLRDDLLRHYCTMVEIADATEQTVNNIFMYAPYRLISAVRSQATIINTSADFLGFGEVYRVSDHSRVTVVNALRSAGKSLSCDESSSMDLYNRINTEIFYEGDYHSASGQYNSDTPDFVVLEKAWMEKDGNTDKIRYAVPCYDPEHSKEQDGFCYRHTAIPSPDEPVDVLIERDLTTVDVSRFMERDGYLHFWVWVDDMSSQLWGGNIQLSSSGRADTDCLLWVSTSYLTHNGWNEVWLSLADAKKRGTFDPTAANYFRMGTIHNPTRNRGRVYFSDIYFCIADSDKIRKPME